MYAISPTVTIDASPEQVWEFLKDVEEWWVASNPDHESLEVYSDGERIEEGTRIRVRERIAGIPGVADGEVTEYVPGERLTWEAPKARYRFYGFPLEVDEGVTWKITPTRGGTELTARVWASFPDSVLGTITEWTFEHVLHGVERDYRHAMRELEYIKRSLEGTAPT
ncbi:SRPBCC family protein [Haloferax chudinovii]|uniref:SRPBCC family protein n=1 Tax=Haloferax chudinovii TaxID=1109010 RepID=A0ABD5XIC0_9EURY